MRDSADGSVCRESLSSPRSSALLGLGPVSPQERLPALEPGAHASCSAPSIPAGPAAPFTPKHSTLDGRLALGKHQMDALNAPLHAESSRRLKAQEQQDAAAPFTPRKAVKPPAGRGQVVEKVHQ